MKKGVFNTIDDYEITKTGEVINKKTGRVLKLQPNSKGYLRVQLTNKSKYFVHRLVAKKYIPNPNNLPQVNHIDGNKLNNCVDNLEWVTNIENRKHAVKNKLHLQGDDCPWSKLTSEDVIFIRKNRNNYSVKYFSQKFNVSVNTIRDVLHGRTWKNISD